MPFFSLKKSLWRRDFRRGKKLAKLRKWISVSPGTYMLLKMASKTLVLVTFLSAVQVPSVVS